MKRTIYLCLLLAGCGGGSVDEPTVAAQKDAVVGFMGDSITAQMDTASCVPGSFNGGVPAETTKQMADRYPYVVLFDRKPDVVVILGGTNDVLNGLDSVESIHLMALMTRLTNAIPIIATIPPNGTGGQLVTQWNDRMRDLAAAHAYKIVDYHPLFLSADGSQNMALFNDPVHPNKAGHDLMCEAVKKVIAKP
jgi:lysophospholipase L1-like esterase